MLCLGNGLATATRKALILAVDRQRLKRAFFLLPISLTLLCPVRALAGGYAITLHDLRFSPATLEIPANTKVRITVRNDGNISAEFESSDLNREKIVGPGGKIIVYVGPLDPGTYAYFDDFHPQSSGTIVVK